MSLTQLLQQRPTSPLIRTPPFVRFCALSCALCTTFYGYDASMFNAVQGDDDWLAWFDMPSAETIGGINTAFSVCSIICGFFVAGTVADRWGRKVGMALGSCGIIIGVALETGSPQGKIACFIVGRAIVGVGLGLALGM